MNVTDSVICTLNVRFVLSLPPEKGDPMQTSFCTLNESFIEPRYFKKFHFTDETDIIELSCSSSDSLCSASDQHVCRENCLNLKINEILDPEFGLYVWPSAPVLGKYIWICRNSIKDKKILELGAGTALPSIVAAKCGAQVTITDSEKYKYVLKLAEYNMLSNNINGDMFKISELIWGKFTPFIINSEQFDLILGSDVFYNPSDFEDILVTVSYILKKNTKAEFWCTYEHRCSDWNINNLLKKWNLTCIEVPLNSFGADTFNVAGSDLPGLKTISLYIISYFSPKQSD